MTMTNAKPSRRGFGRGRRRALSRAADRTAEPVGERPTAAGGPDISQAVGGLRCPDRRAGRRDRCVLAVAGGTGVAAQSSELLHLRRQVGHHQHLGDAIRNPRSVAGDRVGVGVRVDPGDADRPGRCHIRHAVRAAAGRRSAGLRGRSARRGSLDHLRRVGSVCARTAAATRRDLAQPHHGLVLPVRQWQRVGGRRRHHLHRRDRAWR